jgi:hypothetical protein
MTAYGRFESSNPLNRHLATLRRPFPQRQTLLFVEAADQIPYHIPAFAVEHDPNSTMPKPNAGLRNLSHSLAQLQSRI